MLPTADHVDFLREFHPGASADLVQLYRQVTKNGDLLDTDFFTIRDLLELSGYADQEPLHALLLCMSMALDEGSPCIEVSEASLMRRLGDLLTESEARRWSIAIGTGLDESRFGALIGHDVNENKPVVLHRASVRTYLYFQRYLKHEHTFERLIRGRLLSNSAVQSANFREILREVLHRSPLQGKSGPLQLNQEQKLALGVALLRNFAIISGGPGTGKTSIVFSLLRCLVRCGIKPERMVLAAPTGRAAQRLTDSLRAGLYDLPSATQINGADGTLKALTATTLHQLLRYNPSRGTFLHHEENPLSADVVIVDEVSMVSVVLMAQLFQAILPTTRLILLGDKDQLPSVEAGALLSYLVPSDAAPSYSANLCRQLREILPEVAVIAATQSPIVQDAVVVLEQNYRSQKQIQDLAGAVNRQDQTVVERLTTLVLPHLDGNAPKTKSANAASISQSFGSFGAIEKQLGCAFLELARGNPSEWKRALELWIEYHFLAPPQGEEPYPELVACCRVANDTEIATEQKDYLSRIFAVLERSRILTLIREGIWGSTGINEHVSKLARSRLDRYCRSNLFAGLPVLITRNDPRRNLYNGDVGITIRGADGYRVVFQRQEGYLSYAIDALPAHEPAFALTVHKSQGSEYGRVLLALPPDGARRLLTKELIYTAITRAKHLAIVCGSREVLASAIGRKVERESALVGLSR